MVRSEHFTIFSKKKVNRNFITGGLNWMLSSAPQASWWSVVSDSTGMYLAAGQRYSGTGQDRGYIFVSTNGKTIYLN